MHAIASGAAGEVWAALGQELGKAKPRPRALLVVTAHWETNLPMLSGNAKPSMIYDFGGFPEELYRIQYAAPGAPDLATRASTLLKAAGITAAIDGCRGLDHGTWVPLLRMFPGADIPVVQLSVQPSLGASHAWRVGEVLAPLREEGVAIIGSGHLTHNLRDWMMAARSQTTETAPYAREFKAWMFAHLQSNDVEALTHYRDLAPHAVRAHPSEEHLLPLFIARGAAGADAKTERVFEGFEGSALAMDAYRFT
jgi:4,5-DOPA dioxygenase extradiol